MLLLGLSFFHWNFFIQSDGRGSVEFISEKCISSCILSSLLKSWIYFPPPTSVPSSDNHNSCLVFGFLPVFYSFYCLLQWVATGFCLRFREIYWFSTGFYLVFLLGSSTSFSMVFHYYVLGFLWGFLLFLLDFYTWFYLGFFLDWLDFYLVFCLVSTTEFYYWVFMVVF